MYFSNFLQFPYRSLHNVQSPHFAANFLEQQHSKANVSFFFLELNTDFTCSVRKRSGTVTHSEHILTMTKNVKFIFQPTFSNASPRISSLLLNAMESAYLCFSVFAVDIYLKHDTSLYLKVRPVCMGQPADGRAILQLIYSWYTWFQSGTLLVQINVLCSAKSLVSRTKLNV